VKNIFLERFVDTVLTQFKHRRL